jgi:hypothetical protein
LTAEYYICVAFLYSNVEGGLSDVIAENKKYKKIIVSPPPELLSLG